MVNPLLILATTAYGVSLHDDFLPENRERLIAASNGITTPIAILDGSLVTIEDGCLVHIEDVIIHRKHATRPAQAETIKAYCILLAAAIQAPEIAASLNWEKVFPRVLNIIGKEYITTCTLGKVYIHFPEIGIAIPH